jgi:hypothetical protein
VRLVAELDDADRRAEQIARGLTLEQLNWHPRPGAWSVGQCLEHLLIANTLYLPAIAEALDGRSESPVDQITPGWFSRWFIRNFIAPSPQGTRAPAPRKIRPSQDVDASILDAFLHSNARARDVVLSASRHDVNRIRFRNPFMPLLRFTVGTGLEIIAKHESRHLLQAERVTQAAGFPLRAAT